MLDNKQLRKSIRLRRKNISAYIQYSSSIKIANFIVKLDEFHKSKNIGIFFSFDGEINTYPLILKLWLYKKNVFLPRIQNEFSKELFFSEYFFNTKLIINKFGIFQPEYKINDLLFVNELDIIFVPLVAFNSVGNRLGMGQGYYDRMLLKKKLYFYRFSL